MIEDELEQPQEGSAGYQAPNNPPDPIEDAPTDTDTGEQALDDLREATPAWIDQPQPGAAGFKAPNSSDQAIQYPHLFSNKSDYTAPFPETLPADQVIETTTAADQTNEYSFELELDSIDTEAYTIDIHVGYGEINDTPPDGMTGADDYILTIPGAADGTEIYAVVTYNTDTLAITSRSLGFNFSVPDSTFGTLYVPIGYVDIAYAPTTGAITEVNPHNRHCGDINVAFVYGIVSAARAVFTLQQLSDPVAVT